MSSSARVRSRTPHAAVSGVSQRARSKTFSNCLWASYQLLRGLETLFAHFGQEKLLGAAGSCSRFGPNESVPLQRLNVPPEHSAIHGHIRGQFGDRHGTVSFEP